MSLLLVVEYFLTDIYRTKHYYKSIVKEWVDIKAILALWLSFTVFVAVYISSALWPVSQSVKDVLLGVMYLLPPGAAAVGTLNAFLVIKGKERLYWLCVSIAMASMFAGEAYWIIRQMLLGSKTVPSVSFTNVVFLIGYIFLFISLIALRRSFRERYHRFHDLAITVLLMICCAAALWYFQFASIYVGYASHYQIDRFVGVIYPILDVALIVGICATAFFTNALRWPPWLVSIIIGLIMYAFGDIAFTYFSVAGAYQQGTFLSNIIDSFWMSCYIFIFNGALMRIKGGGFHSDDPETEF
jgi:hypothetical protein